jgi:hypothetical protein
MYMGTHPIIVNPIDKLPNSIGFLDSSSTKQRVGSGGIEIPKKGNVFVADGVNEYFTYL